MPNPLLRVLTLAAVAAGVAGCGYRFEAPAAPFGAGQRVFLESLDNATAEPGVEVLASDALRRALRARGPARLVTRPGGADLRLSGRVAGLSAQPRTLSRAVRATEVELALRLELLATDASGRPIPLDPHALVARETYLSSADLEVERRHRREALLRLSEVVARQVWDEVALRMPPEPAPAAPATQQPTKQQAPQRMQQQPGDLAP